MSKMGTYQSETEKVVSSGAETKKNDMNICILYKRKNVHDLFDTEKLKSLLSVLQKFG